MLYYIHAKATEIRIAVEIINNDTNEIDRTVFCDPQDIDTCLAMINRKYENIGRIT